MSFNVYNEIDKITELNKKHKLDTYNMDSLNTTQKFQLIQNLVNIPGKGIVDSSLNKNFKMEFYFPIFNLIVNTMNKVYSSDKSNIVASLDNLLTGSLLNKLTNLSKGQILLNKLNHRIQQIIKTEDLVIENLHEAAKSGTFMTFLFWLNKTKEKKIESLPASSRQTIFVDSIANSDDRLYKFILEKVLAVNKIFFQQNNNLIISLLISLSKSSVPSKYILKRIKLLSNYISLVPYFSTMIDVFKIDKVIFELHKHYYEIPHNYKGLHSVIETLIKHIPMENDNWADEDFNSMIDTSDIMKLYSMLKTDEEKCMIYIILSINHNAIDNHMDPKIINSSTFEKVVKDNYIEICENIDWNKFVKTLNINLNKKILEVLTSENLVTKYINNMTENNKYFKINYGNNNQSMFLFTRFLPVTKENFQTGSYNSNVNLILKVISYNKLLHNLRMLAKRKCKNKEIQQKVKMFDLLKEIKNFSPIKSKPVLSRGSIVYQQQKQKFNNLPPRHLLPGELGIYNNFLLKEKADGILINNLPIGIFPQNEFSNSYQVKAEYIEDLDLYLVFDIDIPNTCITERYNILRQSHPYTVNSSIKNIDSLDDFVSIFNEERQIIKDFIKNNMDHSIKWYPKFSCLYNGNNTNKKIYEQLIRQVILEKDQDFNELIKSSEPFGCDGLILTPLDGDREIKIKPRSMMTIDLLFDGKRWIDRNKADMSNLIIKPKSTKKEGRIYRCYPSDDFANESKFSVGEYRYDKKQPNPKNIVENIVNMIKYDWESDISNMESYYYDNKKQLTSGKLIDTIKAQNELLVQKIASLEPSVNKCWLDLGCGRGKLIQHIKKYNPKYYLGLDADIKQLVLGLKYHDENQNVYHFNPCNLANTWSDTKAQWINISSESNIKFDYVVANFSLMHFFTDDFWQQLNQIVHEETKFIFNLVSETNTEWSESDSFLKIDKLEQKTTYKFEWVHDDVKVEPLVTEAQLKEKLEKYNWKVLNKYEINSKHSLLEFYNWWVIQKC